jgi:hypothetical protein
MSQMRLEHRYHCWNDCLPQGCPGHTAVLRFQSVSDALHFSDGKGHDMYMQTPELEAFLSMLHILGKSYTEIESVLDGMKNVGDVV